MKKRNFLNSKKGKVDFMAILLIAGIIIFAIVVLPKLDLGFELPYSLSGEQGQSGVAVNKKVQFSATNYYSGAVRASDTITVYDAETFATIDSLTTDSDGLAQTTANHPSGKKLAVKFNDGSNGLQWFDITVPYMNEHDAEANTYNDVALETFAIGTYTTDRISFSGTAIADAGKYNDTLSGTTPIFVYELSNTGADNTGLMDSYDPIYQQAWEPWVEIKISGTGWETVVLSGVDRLETIGSAFYGYCKLSSSKLTSWKIGNNYVDGYRGTDSISFALDLSGYTSNSVTVQVTARMYADPNYAVSHGATLGPSVVEIAETTFTIDDT